MQRFIFLSVGKKDGGATINFIGCREKKFEHCKLARKLLPSTQHTKKERKKEKKEKLIKPKAEEEYNALPRFQISRKLLSLCP